MASFEAEGDFSDDVADALCGAVVMGLMVCAAVRLEMCRTGRAPARADALCVGIRTSTQSQAVQGFPAGTVFTSPVIQSIKRVDKAYAVALDATTRPAAGGAVQIVSLCCLVHDDIVAETGTHRVSELQFDPTGELYAGRV